MPNMFGGDQHGEDYNTELTGADMSFDANDTAYGPHTPQLLTARAYAKRIAELEAEREAARTRSAWLESQLEAELAKRNELPPLPESVRTHLRNCRAVVPVLQWTRDLIEWEDTHYPKPVPQWELDAQYLERKLGGETRSAYSPGEVKAIAARIREANRESK